MNHKTAWLALAAVAIVATGTWAMWPQKETKVPMTEMQQSSQQEAKAQKMFTVEGVTQYQLPNGLRVVLFPDSGKPTLTVNMTYLVGSRHEGYGETGMAHLL